MQHVLITGGSGLLALNWALAVRDRYSITLGLHSRSVSIYGTQAQNIDLESVDALVRVFEDVKPNAVIHTAGMTSVEMCEFEPELAYHVNVTLASNVAKACAKVGIKLVHISTDHLFSGHDALVTEDHQIAPINVYGKTKGEAEFRVQESNPRAMVIRTNFYGWGAAYRPSFSDTIINSLRTGDQLTLFQDVFYTPILAEVVVQAVHDLIDIGAVGVFNIAGDERISKCAFGFKVAKAFSLDPSRIATGLIADRVGLIRRPHDMSLSSRKICSLLGRRLGGVDEHLKRLAQQEREGIASEMRNV